MPLLLLTQAQRKIKNKNKIISSGLSETTTTTIYILKNGHEAVFILFSYYEFNIDILS